MGRSTFGCPWACRSPAWSTSSRGEGRGARRRGRARPSASRARRVRERSGWRPRDSLAGSIRPRRVRSCAIRCCSPGPQSLEEIAPRPRLLTVAPGFLAGRPSAGRAQERGAHARGRARRCGRLLAGRARGVRGAGDPIAGTRSDPPTPVYLLPRARGWSSWRARSPTGPCSWSVSIPGRSPGGAQAPRGGRAAAAGRSLDGFPTIFIVPDRPWPTAWRRRSAGPSAGSRRGRAFLTYPSAARTSLAPPGRDRAATTTTIPRRLSDATAARVCGRVRAVRTARALPRPAAAGARGGRRGPRLPLPGPHSGGRGRAAGARGRGVDPHHSPRRVDVRRSPYGGPRGLRLNFRLGEVLTWRCARSCTTRWRSPTRRSARSSTGARPADQRGKDEAVHLRPAPLARETVRLTVVPRSGRTTWPSAPPATSTRPRWSRSAAPACGRWTRRAAPPTAACGARPGNLVTVRDAGVARRRRPTRRYA